MLAQNFKTPAELEITDSEFEALHKVLRMLEREEVPHVSGRTPLPSSKIGVPNGFNMGFVYSAHDCGTACCIVGWARFFAGDKTLLLRTKTAELEDLFCMGRPTSGLNRGKFSDNITPSEAAIALRNYLTHGEPRWEEAFSG